MACRARLTFDDDVNLHAAIANGSDVDGNTLYHHASRHGCIEILRRLGASTRVDARNATGQTPLHLAASVECVEWLVNSGAQVNVPDANGQMPIFQAFSLDVVKSLLKHGARCDVKDVMNNTPVHYMLMRSHLPEPTCVQLLLDAGADANGQNHKLWTPLFYCAFADQDNEDKQRCLKRLVLLLLDKGADPNVVDMNGFTVAHYLALKGRCELLAIILPRMNYNVSSVSRQTVKNILCYYYKDDAKRCSLVKCLEKKLKRCIVSPNISDYQAKTSQIIDCYFSFSKELFDDWSERIKSKPYVVRSKARKFLEKLHHCCSGKELLNISKKYYLGTFHSDSCCPEEKCQIGQSIRETLETIMDVLRNSVDGRYAFQVLPVGSSADGTKLFLPDEFDYLLVSRDVHVIQSIRPTYFKTALSEAIKLAFVHGAPKDDRLKFLFLEAVNLRPKMCYKIHFSWRGKSFKNVYISVDLTPVWRCSRQHDDDQLSSEYWQMLSGVTDALPPERREFFVIIPGYAASSQVVITIPTIENWFLTSYGDVSLEAYRLLKLIISSYAIVSGITEGMYNVKTAFLNYLTRNGPPKDRDGIPCYVKKIIEDELINSENIAKFGFDGDRGYQVRNWCHRAHQDDGRKFPLLKKFLSPANSNKNDEAVF